MTRIAVLRCGKLPRFVTSHVSSMDGVFVEDDLLIREFEAQGFQVSPVVWSQPGIDWSRFDMALIRSTWDYIDDQEHFLRVLSDIEASTCRLFNPLPAIRWNMDKHYLLELEGAGVAIIPTYPASSVDIGALARQFDDRGWRRAILKPSIGLGGSYSHRVPSNELGNMLTTLEAEQPGLAYLIQPFIDDIATEGEWSFVYFDRRLSHVLLKKPAPGDYRVQGLYGGSIRPAEPTPEDLRLADAVMAAIPFDTLYARLDFVRIEGRLAVMEAELIEPILSLDLVPGSAGRLVDAVSHA